jgi:hypothetical protein
LLVGDRTVAVNNTFGVVVARVPLVDPMSKIGFAKSGNPIKVLNLRVRAAVTPLTLTVRIAEVSLRVTATVPAVSLAVMTSMVSRTPRVASPEISPIMALQPMIFE